MSARPKSAPSGGGADHAQAENPASSSIALAFEAAAGHGENGFNPKEYPSMVGLVEDAFADVAGDAVLLYFWNNCCIKIISSPFI